jgi:hypothetical protein
MKKLTIISFYTKSWEYSSHAERLKNECKALGLPYYIEEYQDTGDWLTNTRIKPNFIYEAYNKLKSPVLWIDVDGSIYNSPKFIIDNGSLYDFMGRHQRTGPKRSWHVGTLYFNYTDKSSKLLEYWKNSTQDTTGSDEASFEVIWSKYNQQLNLKYCELPEEYFQILNLGGILPKTVIAHRLSKCPSKIDMKKRNAKKISQS